MAELREEQRAGKPALQAVRVRTRGGPELALLVVFSLGVAPPALADQYRVPWGPYGAPPGPVNPEACEVSKQPWFDTREAACQGVTVYQPLCDRASAIYRNTVATYVAPDTCHVAWEFQNIGSSVWSSWSTNLSFQVCAPGNRWIESANACVPIVDLYAAGSPPKSCGKGNPIYPLQGNKRQEIDTGLRLGGLSFKLAYDSAPRAPMSTGGSRPMDVGPAALGALWSSSLHRRIAIQGIARGAQAVRGDGHTISFSGNGSGVYTPDADTNDRLLVVSGGGYRYVDAGARTLETYDSTGKLSAIAWASGDTVTLSYSTSGTASSIAPAAGYLIQAQDNRGRTVNFTYLLPAGANAASGGLINQITDPAGQSIGLAYDASGNLKSLAWSDAKVKTLLYENTAYPWALTGITDETSVRYATFGYDAEGRATSTEYAGGVNRYSAVYTAPPQVIVTETYDSAAQVLYRSHKWSLPEGVVVTDPQGSNVGMGVGSIIGKNYMTSQGQPAGSGCAASTSAQTYDANGNLASSDDFNGSRTCSEYDLSRNLETARIEGLANTQACSAVTPAGSTLPTGSRKVSTAWHPDWRLEARRAEPGKLTTNIYNGQPDPFNAGAAASCAPSTAPLPDGKPIAVLCKRVEQATTDANGSQGTTASGSPAMPGDPDFGNVALLLHGDLSTSPTLFIDSSAYAHTLSASGGAQVTTVQSKFGGSSISFAGTGNLSFPDGAEMHFGAGDFTIELWFFQPNTTGYGLISNRPANASGWALQSSGLRAFYNGSWSDTKISWPVPAANAWHHLALVRSGTTLRAFIDGVQQGTGTINGSWSDGATSTIVVGAATNSGEARFVGYIDDLRVTKGAARYAGAFTPGAGAFPDTATSVPAAPSLLDTSVLPRVRSYTYSQYGEVLTEKDPLNNTTTYAYYADTTTDHTIGDLQSVTNAKNQVTSYTKYNRHGQLLESTDPNGVVTTNTYDLRQRLLSTSVGGQTTSYEYDAAGQLLKVTSPDQSWIGYEYDAAHRQTAIKDNLGNRIEYVLDNAGNKTSQSVKDPGGNLARSLARSIDALGRVQQTTGRE